ncbi:MAG: trypsin-like peptidase domain-containing protein, partial [Alphaproteobacteria bacterium]|nr:trypsin-like peptidase domain-containing protein [Alphaproteobacteria bacterium]
MFFCLDNMDNNSRGDCPDNIDNDGAAVVCLNDMNNDDGGRPSRLNNIDSDGAAVVRLNDEDFDSDSRGGFLKNFGAVIVALGAAVAASAAASAQDGFGHIIEPSLKAVVTVTVIPATDTISRGDSDQDTLQKWLENFFGEQNRNSSSTAIGSGFLVSEDGLIVTNAHVVSAGSEVTVSLHDDSEHPARLVGKDAASDLALLKIEHPGALPFLRWGDDSRSRVGDWAIALGNPFALGTLSLIHI